MITYAAYAGRDIDLRQAAIVTVLADTGISLLAGLAVFPLVFAHGLDVASGPGLVFVTLPIAFARMPFGSIAAIAFFLLLFVAALSSAISTLELAVAFVARRFAWQRPKASAAVAGVCFVGGFATVFSFNHLSHWEPTPFDLIDHVTSNVMLPLVGLAISLFAGWVLPASLLAGELGLGGRGLFVLRVALRWLAPALIAAVAAASLLA